MADRLHPGHRLGRRHSPRPDFVSLRHDKFLAECSRWGSLCCTFNMWILTRVTFFQQRAFLSKMMSENINPALISHDMLLLVNMAFKTQGVASFTL